MHGTFGLIKPIADDLPENPAEFVGYKVLKGLFETLLKKQHVSAPLSPDVQHWLDVLGGDPERADILAPHHACL